MPDNKSVSEYANQRANNKKFFGFEVRNKLFPGEDKYFKKNPKVTGMASKDGKIILNPYSKLSQKQRNVVKMNEALRLKMRKDNYNPPKFAITDKQKKFFEGTEYEDNPKFMRETILARIYSGDPSAMATEEQRSELKKYLGSK
tara:strand:- start:65 stop:496 length:432 start_codon:yes stop_codon:yes gene_type:complete